MGRKQLRCVPLLSIVQKAYIKGGGGGGEEGGGEEGGGEEGGGEEGGGEEGGGEEGGGEEGGGEEGGGEEGGGEEGGGEEGGERRRIKEVWGQPQQVPHHHDKSPREVVSLKAGNATQMNMDKCSANHQ